MQLYSYYRSSASYRVRIALNIKKLAYTYHEVNLVTNGGEQHAPEYKNLNPQEQVPTLIDGGFILTQSLAILEYLEEKYPEPRILPKDPERRAYVRQLAQVCVSDIHPLNNLKVLIHLSAALGVTQKQKVDWYHKWIRTGFDAMEKLLEKSPFRTGAYCCGNTPTMADLCLVPQVYNARRYEVDMGAWPLISAIDAACLKLETFLAASPECQPDTPENMRARP
ncbi:MAG: maleylacetoacetate isomerase [Alphaproteobacteria bacterium]|nr:maleylacetoacetate isomerase [Alphaproteobacteria bacterium]